MNYVSDWRKMPQSDPSPSTSASGPTQRPLTAGSFYRTSLPPSFPTVFPVWGGSTWTFLIPARRTRLVLSKLFSYDNFTDITEKMWRYPSLCSLCTACRITHRTLTVGPSVSTYSHSLETNPEADLSPKWNPVEGLLLPPHRGGRFHSLNSCSTLQSSIGLSPDFNEPLVWKIGPSWALYQWRALIKCNRKIHIKIISELLGGTTWTVLRSHDINVSPSIGKHLGFGSDVHLRLMPPYCKFVKHEVILHMQPHHHIQELKRTSK